MRRSTHILVMAAGFATASCSGSTKVDTAAGRDRVTPAAAGAVETCAREDVGVWRAIDSTMAHAEAELRRTGDMESLWALYADDAIFMWDNQRIWRGKKEARREAQKALGDLRFTDHEDTVEDVIVCGDLAVQVARFKHTLRRANGEVVVGTGKNLKAWRRQPDGAWKIVRNLGNDDAPLGR